MRDRRESDRPKPGAKTPGGKAQQRREQFERSRGLDPDATREGASRLPPTTKPKSKRKAKTERPR